MAVRADARAGGIRWSVRRDFGRVRVVVIRAPHARWRLTEGPWFATMLAELRYDGRRARIRFDRTLPGASGAPGLEAACEAELAACEAELNETTDGLSASDQARRPFG
jgi:hypothetical protein